MSENALWELMEMEAVERYYLDRPNEGFRAKRPGIMITSGMFRAPDARNQEHFTVWFGPSIAHWNFRNLIQARTKVQEILKTANKPVSIRVKKRGED